MKKKHKPPNEDEAQSKRFTDLARELEAAGDLSLTDAEKRLGKLMEKAAPPKRPARP